MVFFFELTGGAQVYMGRDKFENEELIAWGWDEDYWFHVANMSSAHVYLRLQPGQDLDSVDDVVIEECCQLVKANSIEGCKRAEVEVNITPWSNLLKTADMQAGAVSFHSNARVITRRVTKNNEIVKRLNKTRTEPKLDWKKEKEAMLIQRREEAKAAARAQAKADALEAAAKREAKEAAKHAYDAFDPSLNSDAAVTNADLAGQSVEDYEDGFM